MNIDTDAHFNPPDLYQDIPPRYDDAPRVVDGKLILKNGLDAGILGRWPANFQIGLYVNAMKEAGFDKMCLTPGVPCGWMVRWIKPETELYLVKTRNTRVAKVLSEHDCFIGVAEIPHRDPVEAAAEADRAVKDLGFSAISIQGNWADRPLASPDWWDFFAKIEKLQVPLFVHAEAMSAVGHFHPYVAGADQISKLPGVASWGVFPILTFLLQYQVSMASLIFLGVLDRFPKLKFAWLEADVGWIPSFMGFVDSLNDLQKVQRNADTSPLPQKEASDDPGKVGLVVPKKKASQYFRDNFYYSISIGDEIQYKHLIPLAANELGLANNMLIASDFDHTEGSLDIVRRIMQTKGIGDDVKERICGRNAAELLKVKWAPSAYEKLYA